MKIRKDTTRRGFLAAAGAALGAAAVPCWGDVAVTPGPARTLNTDLAALRTAESLESLGISGLNLDSLSPINRSIDSLRMFGTVSPDISRLSDFRDLKTLGIEIRSSSELVHVAQLVQLEELQLVAPNDAELAQLSVLSKLRKLSVHGTDGR